MYMQPRVFLDLFNVCRCFQLPVWNRHLSQSAMCKTWKSLWLWAAFYLQQVLTAATHNHRATD